MNETITIDGQEYEVLPMNRISEITHAKLAGGKVVDVRLADARSNGKSFISFDIDNLSEVFWVASFEDLGIQPLNLLPKNPVEFTGRCFGGEVNPESKHIMLEVPSGAEVKIGALYKLVQLTEEA